MRHNTPVRNSITINCVTRKSHEHIRIAAQLVLYILIDFVLMDFIELIAKGDSTSPMHVVRHDSYSRVMNLNNFRMTFRTRNLFAKIFEIRCNK